MMRFWRICTAILAATAVIGPAFSAIPASAQTPAGSGSSGSPDLLPVVLWTFVSVVVAMSVLSVGYLYRRTRGLARPLIAPPVPSAVIYPEAETEERVPITAHDVEEHAVARHADELEQAALLHQD